MAIYSHILLALDLSPDCDKLMKIACPLAEASQAKLSLLHVIEPLYFSYQGDLPFDLLPVQEQLTQNARNQLKHYAERMSYEPSEIIVAHGQTSNEIHSMANALDADLVIVGSHGRHGIAVLLGSTANSVLHGAQCDVLAVRVADPTPYPDPSAAQQDQALPDN